MNPRHLLSPALAAALSLLAAPALAQLQIQRLEIAVDASAREGSLNQFDTNSAAGPLGLPFVVTAAAQQGRHTGTALQTKNGFFSAQASGATPYSGSGTVNTSAWGTTSYALTVTTNTPNTPLQLDFLFTGATLFGSAYYGNGEITVLTSATISAGRQPLLAPAPLPDQWGIDDSLVLNGAGSTNGAFTRQSNGVDVHGIGLPQDHYQQGWVEFRSEASLSRDAYVGHIDFGLLQPGEMFSLQYAAAALVEMRNVNYGGRGAASVVDPFSLAQPPAFQIRMAGLELPTAPVPEPAAWMLMALGVAGLLQCWRRQR